MQVVTLRETISSLKSKPNLEQENALKSSTEIGI